MKQEKPLEKLIAKNHLESIRNKRFLITGATGLIGSSIVDILLYLNYKYGSGNKLVLAGRSAERIVNRFSDYNKYRDYTFVEYDASSGISPNIEMGFDFIIHSAGNAHPKAYASQPVETMLCNLLGLNSLLSIADKNTRVCFISSSEVYGTLTSNNPHKEDEYGYVDLLNARSSYVNSKRASETLCISYSEEYNIDTVIIRPGHIYGPFFTDYDSKASAQFIRNAVNHQDIVMKSKGTQIRSYCFCYDCATAILVALLKGESKQAYNISNPDSVCSIKDFASKLATLSGVNLVFEEASIEEKKGYTIIENSSLDATRLLHLGWEPCFDLEEGLKQCLEYCSDSH